MGEDAEEGEEVVREEGEEEDVEVVEMHYIARRQREHCQWGRGVEEGAVMHCRVRRQWDRYIARQQVLEEGVVCTMQCL